MEVILKQDMDNLGYADEIVKVRPGYARNYLIPRSLAIIASESNRKILAETQKQRAHKAQKIRGDAESVDVSTSSSAAAWATFFKIINSCSVQVISINAAKIGV